MVLYTKDKYLQLKKQNKELKELDQLKSDFISTVSHELRTPLTVIRETIALTLEKPCPLSKKEQKEYLLMGLSNIDRLTRIIDDLLDISKIEAGKFEINRNLTSLTEIVNEAVKNLTAIIKDKKLKIKTDFPQDEIIAYIDKDRINQVFTNLIANAVKFTQKGCITVSIKSDNNLITCSVKDTGQGISKDNLLSIFTKFEQLKDKEDFNDKGTGLGLTISKEIIGQHKGNIWAESELEKGSAFYFTLPQYKSENIIKEFILTHIHKNIKENKTFTVLLFEIKKTDDSLNKENKQKINTDLETLIKKNALRKSDLVVEYKDHILIISMADKKGAGFIEKRILTLFDEYLTDNALQSKVTIKHIIINFPEDSDNIENIKTQLTLF
ncbi:HAMP domain-containing histidine kinase [bacterium]|nr:HAMP domain-containing histidine kinase [bacterium]